MSSFTAERHFAQKAHVSLFYSGGTIYIFLYAYGAIRVGSTVGYLSGPHSLSEPLSKGLKNRMKHLRVTPGKNRFVTVVS